MVPKEAFKYAESLKHPMDGRYSERSRGKNIEDKTTDLISALGSNARASTETSFERKFRKRFEGYTFKRDIEGFPDFNPDAAMIEVDLTTKDEQWYVANFTTLQYLDECFEKNKKTGELLAGTYFGMPDNMVIVQRLDEKTIGRTIDDLIKNHEIKSYFKKVGD